MEQLIAVITPLMPYIGWLLLALTVLIGLYIGIIFVVAGFAFAKGVISYYQAAKKRKKLQKEIDRWQARNRV